MPEPRLSVRVGLVCTALLALAGCSSATTAPPAAPAGSASTSIPASPVPTTATPTLSPSPSGTPSATTAMMYANALEVGADGLITYTPLRWYQGKAARAACAKDGISSPTAWCNDYYFTEAGGRAEARLGDGASITLLDPDGEPTKGTIAQVRRAVADESWPNFRFRLVGDRIDRLEQVYTP